MRNLANLLVQALALVFGVTAVSFILLVELGPDPSFQLAGPHATPEQIEAIRAQLGLDRPVLARYGDYLRELVTLDLGHSQITGEPVAALLARTLPVSLALTLPGFVLGNLLGLALAMVAVLARGRWLDQLIMGASSVTMSISFVVILVGLQVLLCTPYGLDWFPVRGWQVDGPLSYLRYVTVPTFALVLAGIGYNTRFYRGILAEELGRDHVFAQLALGLSRRRVLLISVLPNGLVPILTRLLFSAPLLLVGGSLLIESHFGVPGIGKVTFDAMTSGDRSVLKAVIGLTALLFALATVSVDALYRAIDPRLRR